MLELALKSKIVKKNKNNHRSTKSHTKLLSLASTSQTIASRT